MFKIKMEEKYIRLLLLIKDMKYGGDAFRQMDEYLVISSDKDKGIVSVMATDIHHNMKVKIPAEVYVDTEIIMRRDIFFQHVTGFGATEPFELKINKGREGYVVLESTSHISFHTEVGNGEDIDYPHNDLDNTKIERTTDPTNFNVPMLINSLESALKFVATEKNRKEILSISMDNDHIQEGLTFTSANGPMIFERHYTKDSEEFLDKDQLLNGMYDFPIEKDEAKKLIKVLKAVKDGKIQVVVAVFEGHPLIIVFKNENMEYVFSRYDVPFPRYHKVLHQNREVESVLYINAKVLKEFVARVYPAVAKNEVPYVDIWLKRAEGKTEGRYNVGIEMFPYGFDGLISGVRAYFHESFTVKTKGTITYMDGTSVIRLNIKLLKKVLSVMDSKGDIKIELSSFTRTFFKRCELDEDSPENRRLFENPDFFHAKDLVVFKDNTGNTLVGLMPIRFM